MYIFQTQCICKMELCINPIFVNDFISLFISNYNIISTKRSAYSKCSCKNADISLQPCIYLK